MVIDIRLNPWSRRAAFRRRQLSEALRPMYGLLPDLGNVNYRTGGPIKLKHEERGLAHLAGYLRDLPVIVMCACRDLERCHRRVVAERARERFGVEVVHLDPPSPR